MENSTLPQQGTPEWLEWRKTKVTATDLAAILGISKWDTAYSLWQRKVGFLPPKEINSAMRRGSDLEGVVRSEINALMELQFEPCLVVNPELHWAAASLDGLAISKECGPVILEIKCPNLADHQCAERNKVPDHYFPQVQWQMFCADVNSCLYASHHNFKTICFTVPRDDSYILEVLLPRATEFYRCLVEMEAPPQGEDEIMQINSPEWEFAAREWKAANEMRIFYESKSDHFRQRLIDLTDDSNVTGSGVTLIRVNREGSIDYKAIFEDIKAKDPIIEKDYPVALYRKEQIGYWKLSADKT